MIKSFVTVAWVNYNSTHISEIVLKALDALTRLISSSSNYELIIVENGSIDGSDKLIEEYLMHLNVQTVSRIKYVRLNKNYGFTGAIHIAYKNRDPKAKYFLLVNTDLIINPQVINELVSFLELNPRIGAAQGLVVDFYEDRIDSSGILLDEFLDRKKIYRGMDASVTLKEMNAPFPVSFVEGSVPIYNISAIKECYKRDDIMFIPHAFVWYLEDMYTGLLLWNRGFYSIVIPKIVGRHYRGYALKKLDLSYVALRNEVAIQLLCKNRTYPIRVLKIALTLIKYALLRKKKESKALLTGIQWALKLKKLFGTLDLHKVPLLKSSNFIMYLLRFLPEPIRFPYVIRLREQR